MTNNGPKIWEYFLFYELHPVTECDTMSDIEVQMTVGGGLKWEEKLSTIWWQQRHCRKFL